MLMDRAPVTVVISAYNAARTIERAIESAVSQTQNPECIVVIDDGSTDETRDIVRRLAASSPVPIVLMENGSNAGSSVAKNKGIRAATTRYVALLDADDAWTPDHLSTSLHQLESQEADLVFGTPIGYRVVRYEQGTVPLHFVLVQGGMAQASSYVFRRDKSILFDERVRKHTDFDFIMAVYKAGRKIVQLPHPTTRYLHDVALSFRAGQQRALASSILFYSKWRSLLSPDAKLCFLCWYHFYSVGRIKRTLALKLLARVATSKLAPRRKLSVTRQVIRLGLQDHRSRARR